MSGRFTGGVFAQSASGNVTLSAQSITLRGTVFDEGSGRTGDGLVALADQGFATVTSGTGTTAGQFGSIAIAQGRTGARLTSIDASATGLGGGAVLSASASAGDVTLDSGTVTMGGAGGAAVSATATGGRATVTSGSVIVAANATGAASGIGASGTLGASIRSGTVVARAAAIRGTSTAGDVAIVTTGNTSSLINNAIFASGINVAVTTGQGTTTSTASGPITAGGTTTGAAAILATVTGGTATITNGGTVSATGASGMGIRATATTGTLAINNAGAITTSGTGGNAVSTNVTTGITTIASTGTIATSGLGASGINVVGTTGALTVNSNSVVTTGANSGMTAANGIFVQSTTGALAITSGTVTVSGANATGILAQSTNGGNIAVTAGTTTASGQQANNFAVGILANSAGNNTTGTVTVNSGTASAVANSAIQATGGGAVSITSGTASSSGTNALSATSRLADVAVNATTINLTRIAQGPVQQAAIVANATAGNVVVNAGTVTAEAAAGISSTAGGTGSITATNVSAAGDGFAGVNATGGTGLTLNLGNVSSTGATGTTRADAVFGTATSGAILANIGSASATGAGSDAVRLIANGVGGAVTANITGTLSSTSGAGLFIDPPGAVVVNIASGASVAGALNGINTTGASNTITNRGTIASTGGAAILAAGATALTNAGTIGGANNVAVQLGTTSDTVTLLTGSAVTGRIVGGGGTDAAVLSGTGTVTSAAQTIAGFTGFDSLTVQSGYWTALAGNGSVFATGITTNVGSNLELANGATGLALTAPTIVNNGGLVIRSSAASAGSTFGAGVVSGSGTVLLTGAGTVTLDGINSIQTTGITTIDGGSTVLLTGTQGGSFVTGTTGTLAIGNGGTTGAFTGSLVGNGTLVVNRSDAFTFAGPLTGAGNIVKQGAGQLVFGAGYAFTGTTTIQGGSVRLTTPVAANTELSLEGTGQLDLSGSTQRVAELAGASSAASINIAGGSLTVVQATDTVFAGRIVGAGTFTKSGSGRLNFTGASTYAGPTTINGGTLAVNGSIVSPVTVAAGGTLGGTGSVGAVTVASGGTYAPGNSIGTQTVAGNVTFATGSIFAVEANAAGQADRVNATGIATLQGGTVAVAPAAGTYGNLTNYTILTAAGGVTGTFTAATSADATLTPFLAYGANGVTLTLARNNVVFSGMGTTANQVAVGGAVTALGVGSGIFRALLPLSNAAVSGALGQLSGELYASLPAVLADGSKQVREAVLARATTPGDGFGMWATGTRTLAGSRIQTDIASVTSNRWTAIGGVDFTLSGLRIGIDGGYIEDKTRLRRFGSEARTETKLVGGHVGYARGAMSFVIGGDYAWHDIRAERTLGVAGFGAGTTADSDAHTIQGYGEAGYGIATGTLTVMPFARFSYVNIVSDAFTEGGGLGALTAGRDERHYKFGSVGVRMTGDAPIGGNVTFQPRMSVSYTRGWDIDGARTLAFSGTTTPFSLRGTALGRDAFDVNTGFDLAVGQRFTVGIGGFGSTSSEWSEYGAKASVGLKF